MTAALRWRGRCNFRQNEKRKNSSRERGVNRTQWQSIRLGVILLSVICSACGGQSGSTTAEREAPPKPIFRYQEVMIPMRDGVHLQTVILTPLERQGPLPILLRRTPYGVPDESKVPKSFKEFVQNEYSYTRVRARWLYFCYAKYPRTVQVRGFVHNDGESRPQ